VSPRGESCAGDEHDVDVDVDVDVIVKGSHTSRGTRPHGRDLLGAWRDGLPSNPRWQSSRVQRFQMLG
jgi:hypothetical protein